MYAIIPLCGCPELTSLATVQVAIACIYCLLASGIVFGYAAFKPILISEGVYREYCTEDDPGDDKKICYQQEIR